MLKLSIHLIKFIRVLEYIFINYSYQFYFKILLKMTYTWRHTIFSSKAKVNNLIYLYLNTSKISKSHIAAQHFVLHIRQAAIWCCNVTVKPQANLQYFQVGQFPSVNVHIGILPKRHEHRCSWCVQKNMGSQSLWFNYIKHRV